MKPEHFREVEMDTCAECKHHDTYRHCDDCQIEHVCELHTFNMGLKWTYICEDFEREE